MPAETNQPAGMQRQESDDYARSLFAEDAPERDCLVVCEGLSWWRPCTWYEIVGIRQVDGALRVRHIDTGTLTWLGLSYVVPMTLGAADFINAAGRQWNPEAYS